MTREPDSFLKLQIRRLATGFCWAFLHSASHKQWHTT